MSNKKGRLIKQEKEKQFIQDEILNVDDKGLWQYHYVDFKKDYQYNFENFSIMDNVYRNENDRNMTNYEMIAFNAVRLIVAKTFIQAFDSIEMALLLAEYSRLSIGYDVNKYGFFKVSYASVEKDTGLSEYYQKKYGKILEELGYITTISFRKEKTKFYKFNDDFTRKKLLEYIKGSYKQTPYIRKQI
ncbi:MAG: hypothetical protein ACK5HL_01500 [Bacilli bacterium]